MIITCNSNNCRPDTTTPLFSITNMLPGEKVSTSVTIKNNRSADCFPSLEIVQPSTNLANQLDLSSNVGGTLPANTQKEYSLSITFTETASNSVQAQTTSFDYHFNFRCDDEPLTSSTATTLSPTPSTLVTSSPSLPIDSSLNFRSTTKIITPTPITEVLGAQFSGPLPLNSSNTSYWFIIFALTSLLIGTISKKLILAIFAPIILGLIDYLFLPSGANFYWWAHLLSLVLSVTYFTKSHK